MHRGETAFLIVAQVAPLVLAGVFAVFVPLASHAPASWAVGNLGIYVAGFALFFIAKCSAIRGGRVVSWGPGPMEPRYRKFYWAGYGLMGLAFLMSVSLLIVRIIV